MKIKFPKYGDVFPKERNQVADEAERLYKKHIYDKKNRNTLVPGVLPDACSKAAMDNFNNSVADTSSVGLAEDADRDVAEDELGLFSDSILGKLFDSAKVLDMASGAPSTAEESKAKILDRGTFFKLIQKAVKSLDSGKKKSTLDTILKLFVGEGIISNSDLKDVDDNMLACVAYVSDCAYIINRFYGTDCNLSSTSVIQRVVANDSHGQCSARIYLRETRNVGENSRFYINIPLKFNADDFFSVVNDEFDSSGISSMLSGVYGSVSILEVFKGYIEEYVNGKFLDDVATSFYKPTSILDHSIMFFNGQLGGIEEYSDEIRQSIEVSLRRAYNSYMTRLKEDATARVSDLVVSCNSHKFGSVIDNYNFTLDKGSDAKWYIHLEYVFKMSDK